MLHIAHRWFIVAAAAMLLCTVAAKAQWTRATLPPPYSTGYYLDVFFLPSNTAYGWACSIDGYVVRTTDGGQTWRGTQPGRPFLEYIQFLTPQIGYTSGPAGIYRSDDGGATWTDITPIDPNQEQSWGSYFLNQNEGVYLVGGCSTGLQAFYRTTNGGASWNVSYGNERESGLSDALLYKDGSGFAISSGVVWRTTDYGARWRKHSNTPRRVWHEELAIKNNTFLIPYSGSDCSGSGNNIGGMLWSTDQGFTWKEFNVAQNMYGTCLISEQEGWAVGDGPSAFYTSDGGQTWENRACGLRGDVDDVYFIGDTLGWIAGTGLYKYTPLKLAPGVAIDPPGPIIDICRGDSVLLTSTMGFSSYQWNDGVKGQARFATSEGKYIVTAYDSASCQQFTAEVEIRYYPSETPRILASATEVCKGDSVLLQYTGSVESFTWSTGDTSRTIYVNTSGSYTLTTTDEYGCINTTTPIVVTIHETPEPTITANRRTTICLDETVTLSAPPGYASYQWSTNETTQSITVNTEGTYRVTVVDQFGCVGISNEITVVVLDTRNKIEIQSVLPNNTFELPGVAVGQLSCRTLVIRNRSLTSELTIRDPMFVGNVFFSIPQSQLPLIIQPQTTGELVVCSSPIDTGYIADTLVLSDTCSPVLIPVSCNGSPIVFDGTSRCETPVQTIVIRAGVAHQLSAPYPLPASDKFQLTITPPLHATVQLVNSLGTRVATALREAHDDADTYMVDVSALPVGSYVAVVQTDTGERRSFHVVVAR